MKQTTLVKVDQRQVEISNMDKVFYPKTGFTKGQMLDYYARVADVMVPHLANRPATLVRYPNGVEGPFFYEKECPSYRPKWMHTTEVPRNDKTIIHYCTIDDKASLIWTANLASIEIHVLLSKKANIRCPTSMAFDMDPGPGMTILDCAWAALELKKVLADHRLECFAKSSGKKGMHVYVPLNDPAMTFDRTKEFAHALAISMEKRFPDRIVSMMSKALRNKKIFIDWSQNDEHKTTCTAYSLRVSPQPTVSTPLNWDELEKAIKAKDPDLLAFTTDQVLKRVQKNGDLFAPVLTMKQKLPPFSDAESPPPSTSSKALATYHEKRKFDITPEPQGGKPSPKGKMKFVIQKHAASHLHYDFRLEDKGVLLSWAVPKGPSTDPSVKRLAMHVEDHPLDYAGFEGTIPKGQYGGGTVMVWDQGTYVNLTNRKGKLIPLSEGMAKGHIDFWLQGKKLNGGWSMIRLSRNPKQWLLVKMDDAGAHDPPDPVETETRSALTKRSLQQIADDKKSKVWNSNRSSS